RIIFVNDTINENILIDNNIIDSYFPFKVLLISGLNTIKCEALINKNLNNLNNIFEKSSHKTFTFYEHAGYHNFKIERLVRDFIFPKVNFFSMNEHELANIIQSYDFIENPEFLVNSLIPLRTHHKFDKILIHTSRWSLLFGNESARFKGCLQNAINIASARMIYGDYLNFTDYSNIGNLLEIENKSLEFSKYFNYISQSDFCCLPSYKIRSENLTTIGLGDFFVAGFISSLSEVEYILS
ncbi:MAG: ADP-dependent glucokinase/phosphofructokinase, partial [SAR324 cluster bacterium]|nr:ADP-dependent glucokinase/phosphofructokinase [SAR324 cluster bacterium]